MPIRYQGVSESILDAIGDTPLLEIEGIFAKVEFLNPVRLDQGAHRQLHDRTRRAGWPAEARRHDRRSDQRQHRQRVVDGGGSQGLPHAGGDARRPVQRTRGDLARVRRRGVVLRQLPRQRGADRARELGQQPGFFCPSQFESEWNIEENRLVLGPEILAQLPAGRRCPMRWCWASGTGGTLIGVGQAFRAVNPNVRLFAMEPSESSTILCGEIGTHAIEGISDGFVPGIFQRNAGLVNQVLTRVERRRRRNDAPSRARPRPVVRAEFGRAPARGQARARSSFPDWRRWSPRSATRARSTCTITSCSRNRPPWAPAISVEAGDPCPFTAWCHVAPAMVSRAIPGSRTGRRLRG